MQLYEKIESLERLFTTAQQSLQTLEAKIQRESSQALQAQLDTTKSEIESALLEIIEQEAEKLKAQALAKLTELATGGGELTQALVARLDLSNLATQTAKSFTTQNKAHLKQALAEELAKIARQNTAEHKAEANRYLEDFKQALHMGKAQLLANMGKELAHLLEENKTSLLARLDVYSSLAPQVEEKLSTLLKSETFNNFLQSRASSEVSKRAETAITSEAISQEVRAQTTKLIREELASDEVIRLRYETALRLSSLKCYATQEIIQDIITQQARAANYKNIVEKAKATTKQKLLAEI